MSIVTTWKKNRISLKKLNFAIYISKSPLGPHRHRAWCVGASITVHNTSPQSRTVQNFNFFMLTSSLGSFTHFIPSLTSLLHSLLHSLHHSLCFFTSFHTTAVGEFTYIFSLNCTVLQSRLCMLLISNLNNSFTCSSNFSLSWGSLDTINLFSISGNCIKKS